MTDLPTKPLAEVIPLLPPRQRGIANVPELLEPFRAAWDGMVAKVQKAEREAEAVRIELALSQALANRLAAELDGSEHARRLLQERLDAVTRPDCASEAADPAAPLHPPKGAP